MVVYEGAHELKKLSVNGGVPEVVASGVVGPGAAAWGPNGDILSALTHNPCWLAPAFFSRRSFGILGAQVTKTGVGQDSSAWNGIGSHSLPIVGCRLDSLKDPGHGANCVVPSGLTIVLGGLLRIRIATASPLRVPIASSHEGVLPEPVR